MNVAHLFFSAARQFPLKVAIIDKEKKITYQQLQLEVSQTAQYFANRGITEGDRVLVFVPMSIDLYRIVLALFSLGATAVFLDEWVNMKRLSVCCNLAECKGFIGGLKARTLGFLSKEIRKIPIKLSASKLLLEEHPIVDVDPNTTALITFTTGSTGVPKAANRTHAFLNEQFKALLHEINPQESDIDMVVLPIVLFVNLGVGCTSVIADFKMTKPNRMKVSTISQQLLNHKVNRITASPFFIKKLAKQAVMTNDPFMNIEKVFTGGAPVFPDEAILFTKAFQKANTTIVYGSTESEPISSITAELLIKKRQHLSFGLPVGKPDINIDLKIINISTSDIPNCTSEELSKMEKKEGEIGEIIVSGNHVLKQYFKNENAFKANKIVVNNTIWHRTGDSGKLINGELYLNGRCAQLIERNGKIISPFIIENQIQSINGLNMGTVIETNGKLTLAVETSLNKQDLTHQLTNIPYDSIKLVNPIPRDPRHHSKIDYTALIKQIS